MLTERLGMRLYPATGSSWRRILVPIAGSLTMGWLLYRYFPYARGSGVPQTKAALFAREGQIRLTTVLERLGSSQLDLLPVVSRANAHQLLGVVSLRDVLQSYGVGNEA